MSLFTIGDPHLSLGSEKPMDIFKGWQDYTERLEKNWRKLVGDKDTVVITGDVSWAMKLEETEQDFAFLHRLPGIKLLVKGNHDYWWPTRKKIDSFLDDKGFSSIRVVYNDAVRVDNVAVCGTRGWFYDAENDADKKVLLREVGRLKTSIAAAEKTGGEPVVFLHYPPVYNGVVCEEMMHTLEEAKIRRCYYGHLHGAGISRAVTGNFRGIHFSLVSCDAVQFCPVPVEITERLDG